MPSRAELEEWDGLESLGDSDAGSMRSNTYGGGHRFGGVFFICVSGEQYPSILRCPNP